ncbi:MAG: hypothetical protein RL514_1000 [Verrucomicrobiota bacterium]|jgi:hypothetical protein
MKILLLLALGLAVVGCREEAPQPEVLDRLKAIETELAKRPVPVRWAYADKSKIEGAIYRRTSEKLANLKKTDALPPEVEAQVAHYESLRMELLRLPKPMPRGMPMPRVMGMPLPAHPLRTPSAQPPAPLPLPKAAAPVPIPVSPAPPPAQTEEEKAYAEAYADLTRRVAEAKAPVAAIVERRRMLSLKYQSPQFFAQLIADYVKQKEHYDVVVDTSSDYIPTPAVLYHTTAEVPDITEGVIRFFLDKEKP